MNTLGIGKRKMESSREKSYTLSALGLRCEEMAGGLSSIRNILSSFSVILPMPGKQVEMKKNW